MLRYSELNSDSLQAVTDENKNRAMDETGESDNGRIKNQLDATHILGFRSL